MEKIKILFFNSRKYDFATALLIEGLNELKGVELFVANLGSYARPEQVLNKADVIEYGNTRADIVVLGSNHYVNHDMFWRIKSRRPKKVFVDGWDAGQLNINPLKFRKFDYIFKVNLYQQDNSCINLLRILASKKYTLWSKLRSHYLIPFPHFHSMQNMTNIKDIIKNIFFPTVRHKVFPLPFSVEKRCQADFNKSPGYMLSCMLSADRVLERKKIITLLQQLNLPHAFIGKISEDKDGILKMEKMYGSDPGVPVHERGYAFHNDAYYYHIRDSRACISVPGGGFDTFRFWEILGMGALLISKRVATQMPNHLIENKHYVAFDSIEELKYRIQQLYDYPEKMDEIRWNGYQYARQYHTSQKRAEYFLDIITDKNWQCLNIEEMPRLQKDYVPSHSEKEKSSMATFLVGFSG